MKSSKEGWDNPSTHKHVQRMQHFVLQGQYMQAVHALKGQIVNVAIAAEGVVRLGLTL